MPMRAATCMGMQVAHSHDRKPPTFGGMLSWSRSLMQPGHVQPCAEEMAGCVRRTDMRAWAQDTWSSSTPCCRS
jgi:hypothetical protein